MSRKLPGLQQSPVEDAHLLARERLEGNVVEVALDVADRHAVVARGVRLPTLRATVMLHLGAIHMRSFDWHNAPRFFEMGLAVREETVSLRLRARLHDGLTAAYQSLGDFASALRSA